MPTTRERKHAKRLYKAMRRSEEEEMKACLPESVANVNTNGRARTHLG